MERTARAAVALVLVVALAVLLPGCAQGPGHTRAAGTLGGAAAGAVVGAALTPCGCGDGAAWGALIGMMAGSTAAEGIAQDQERYGWCARCGRPLCRACCPQSTCEPAGR